MLQSIRDRLTGPVVWFVIGLIAIPFAFWGINTFRSGGGDPVVAKIGGIGPFGGTRITQSQFKQRYEQRYQQLRQLMGEQFRADMFDSARFRQSVLDDMVQETAMRTFGQDAGYRAGDDALRTFLAEIPAFQKDGKFSAETYHAMLARQRGLTAATYEAQVRQALVIDQLKGVVEDTAFVTSADAWTTFRLEGQSRKIGVAQVSVADFKSQVTVTDDQLKARYEKDKSKYRTAERIKLAYVELDRNKLKPTGAAPADELKKIYDAEKDVRFSQPEERHPRHVLVAMGTDKAAAKAKAEKLLEEIKAGKDFAKVAQESSDDTGSKANGGDLDWMRKGQMPVKEIEEAVFSMKPGEVRGPIETQFGFHIVKLDEIREAQVKPYDDAGVQSELADAWRVREAEKKFQETSDKLDEIAFEKSAIADVAKEVGLEVQTSDWIGHDAVKGEGLAGSEAVKQAAFTPEVTTEDQNSKPIVVDADRVVVVHKAEYEPARDRPLEEVKEQVKEAVIAENAAALAKKEGEALVAAVKEGQTIAAAAAAHHAKVTFEGEAKRNQTGVDDQVLAAAFKLARPEGGKPVVESVSLPTGDVAVVALTAVDDPRKPESGDELKTVGQQMRDAVAGSEFGAYRKSIETEVKVDVVRPPTAEDVGNAESPEG